MSNLSKRKFFFSIIVIGVICAAYFIYPAQHSEKLTMATFSLEDESPPSMFPEPGQTLYQMGLYLDINTRTLYGSTILDTVNTTGKPLDELWFTLYPNAFRYQKGTPAPLNAYYAGFDAGWLEINGCKVNGQEVEYILDGVSLKVVLPHDILPSRDINVEMQWQSRVPKVAYRYGVNDGVYMLGNFYPILDVFSEEGWHISYNSLFGDPFCFNCADYLVRLNIPETYQMVSTGSNIQAVAEDNGRVSYLIEAKNVRDFCLAVMYDYNELIQEIKQVTIKCYVPGNNTDMARDILQESGDILNHYSCTLGSYPYPEFKVVFVPMKGFHGMEYSGLIFLREEFLAKGSDQERGLFILAHEIAHQWWYCMVGNDQLKEPWLDEGLANWSAYKYLEKYKGKSPPPAANLKGGINLAREMCDIYSTREYYLTAYTGGEAFWFGLEKELGEETVTRVLRRYLADFRFRTATTKDLLNIIEEEAHQEMDYYFDLWFSS